MTSADSPLTDFSKRNGGDGWFSGSTVGAPVTAVFSVSDAEEPAVGLDFTVDHTRILDELSARSREKLEGSFGYLSAAGVDVVASAFGLVLRRRLGSPAVDLFGDIDVDECDFSLRLPSLPGETAQQWYDRAGRLLVSESGAPGFWGDVIAETEATA